MFLSGKYCPLVFHINYSFTKHSAILWIAILVQMFDTYKTQTRSSDEVDKEWAVFMCDKNWEINAIVILRIWSIFMFNNANTLKQGEISHIQLFLRIHFASNWSHLSHVCRLHGNCHTYQDFMMDINYSTGCIVDANTKYSNLTGFSGSCKTQSTIC